MPVVAVIFLFSVAPPTMTTHQRLKCLYSLSQRAARSDATRGRQASPRRFFHTAGHDFARRLRLPAHRFCVINGHACAEAAEMALRRCVAQAEACRPRSRVRLILLAASRFRLPRPSRCLSFMPLIAAADAAVTGFSAANMISADAAYRYCKSSRGADDHRSPARRRYGPARPVITA